MVEKIDNHFLALIIAAVELKHMHQGDVSSVLNFDRSYSTGEGTSKENDCPPAGIQGKNNKDIGESSNKNKIAFDDVDPAAGGRAPEIICAAQLALRCLKRLTCQDFLECDFKTSPARGQRFENLYFFFYF